VAVGTFLKRLLQAQPCGGVLGGVPVAGGVGVGVGARDRRLWPTSRADCIRFLDHSLVTDAYTGRYYNPDNTHLDLTQIIMKLYIETQATVTCAWLYTGGHGCFVNGGGRTAMRRFDGVVISVLQRMHSRSMQCGLYTPVWSVGTQTSPRPTPTVVAGIVVGLMLTRCKDSLG